MKRKPLRQRLTAMVAAAILSLPIWSPTDAPMRDIPPIPPIAQTRTDGEVQALR